MHTAVGHRKVFGIDTFVFRVPTRDRGDVFMRIDGSPYEQSRRAVVEVDATKFLALWRAEPNSIHADVSTGDPDTWTQDHKFKWAEQGFEGGESNPVPLAEVGCYIAKERFPVYERRLKFFRRLVDYRTTETPYATFVNGITRTIWLMTYGATHFPVTCHADEAPLLQRLAGLPDGAFKLVSELTPR